MGKQSRLNIISLILSAALVIALIPCIMTSAADFTIGDFENAPANLTKGDEFSFTSPSNPHRQFYQSEKNMIKSVTVLIQNLQTYEYIEYYRKENINSLKFYFTSISSFRTNTILKARDGYTQGKASLDMTKAGKYLVKIFIRDEKDELVEIKKKLNLSDCFAFSDISVYPKTFSPYSTYKMFIMVPVKINKIIVGWWNEEYATGSLTLSMAVYNKSGKKVYSQSTDVYTNSIYELTWDGTASANNEAGISTASYAPPGDYDIVITGYFKTKDGSETEYKETAKMQIKITEPLKYGDKYGYNQLNLLPRYTQDESVNYMAKDTLEKIITPGMTNYQKIEAVYFWIIKNCVHGKGWSWLELDDIRAKMTPVYDDKKIETFVKHLALKNEELYKQNKISYILNDDYLWKASGILKYRNGVCYDFAELFKVLVNQLGFESEVVGGVYKQNNGETIGHGWSKVKLNGNWYWVDVDIDGTNWRYSAGMPDKITPAFFLIDNDAEWAKKHGDFTGLDGKYYN